MAVRHGGIQNFMNIEEWIIPVFWNKTRFDVRNSPSTLFFSEYLKMDATSSSDRVGNKLPISTRPYP
jgi:hypothetical protein